MATNKSTSIEAKKQEAMEQIEFDFLTEHAGEGLDTMNGAVVSVAYLGLVQPDSSLIDDDNQPGTWRNSATGHNYGSMVTVVPIAFRTIWSERENEAPYRTVGRYEPNSIKVDIRPVPKGTMGYPKMINPETGNEIQELFVYAVILPDYPEDGVLYLSPTVSSMRTAKAWNSSLKSRLLPNGMQAPIFGFQWDLYAELTVNPKQPNKQIAKFSKAVQSSIVNSELFGTAIKPSLTNVQHSLLQIASNIDEDASENVG